MRRASSNKGGSGQNPLELCGPQTEECAAMSSAPTPSPDVGSGSSPGSPVVGSGPSPGSLAIGSGPGPNRFGLAAACLLHAAIFSAAAAALPWRSGTSFALLVTSLAVLHVITAVIALLRRPSWLSWSWRALSLASVIAFAVLAWWMAASAIYVSKLYERLGPTVAAGILIAAFALALLTLPIAIWGALCTLPARSRSAKRLGASTLALLTFCVLTLPLASSAARGTAVEPASAEVTSRLGPILEAHLQLPAAGKPRSVAGAGPARCKAAIDAERLTLLVAYVHLSRGPSSACLQARNSRKLAASLGRLLRKRARPGSTVVIDLVRSFKPLESSFPLLDALELRPGLDGVCEGQLCLPAWQLTLSDSFAENRPLPSVPDMSFGFSAQAVRRVLGSEPSEQDPGLDGLTRIETDSFSVDASGLHRLIRTRPSPPALSPQGVAQAVEAAQRYIVAAQEQDGTFRYALDPQSGAEDQATLNLPRQAGTTYALCEIGDRAVKETVERALAVFAQRERKRGEFSALGMDRDYGLGKSALPLLAMLRCRDLVGDVNDRLIGRLSWLMLKMQRPDGSFYPRLDLKERRGVGTHEAVYAAGQAVLALVLLEQRLKELAGSATVEALPSAQQVKAALDSAMAYYSGPYWPTPERDFFFFEEGWHCLAARTALSSHRHPAYEQLCLDYVGSRLRFVSRSADTSEPNFVGGYGVSDLFPPRNTATAGLGEALNAAISIKQARGLSVEHEKGILRDLVSFLLRAQWTEAGCYACRKPTLVAGGFSQQLASPSIRIDYVQHAMAAVFHGSKLLGLI